MKFNRGLPLPLFLLLLCPFFSAVRADTLIGVRQGDWVQYDVSFTGNPPPEHDVVWARMEVTGVEEQRVNATFVSQLANGTVLTVEEDLDFATGRLIDMFIIPSGLNSEDAFYAENVGNIEIVSREVRAAAGASRMTLHAEAEDTQWYWDRETGVVVEAHTANAFYTLDTVAVKTGLWNPQILGFDQTVFSVIAVVVAVTVIAAAIVLFVNRGKKPHLTLP
jgi:murein DD-endopeptidase MepM/ murein hydrolase activator NlpD